MLVGIEGSMGTTLLKGKIVSGAHRTLSAERKRRGLVADLALRRRGRRRGAHRGRRLWLLSGRRRRPDGQIYGTDDAMAGGLTGDEVLEGGAFDSWCASIGSRARPPPSEVALTFARCLYNPRRGEPAFPSRKKGVEQLLGLARKQPARAAPTRGWGLDEAVPYALQRRRLAATRV